MNQPSGCAAQSRHAAGDPVELVAVRQAGGQRSVRERRVGDAVGPQAAPPGPVVGRGEAPGRSPMASRPRTRPRAPRRGDVGPRSARRRCGGPPGRTAPPIGRAPGRPGTRSSRRSRCRAPRRCPPTRQTRRHLAERRDGIREVLEDLVGVDDVERGLVGSRARRRRRPRTSTFATPAAAASARAATSGSSTASMPITRPGATRRARSMVIVPGPHPTSRRSWPGARCGSR